MNKYFNRMLTYCAQRKWASLLFFLLITLLIYSATAFKLYDPNCFVYSVAAQGLLDGKVLYKTAWQDKPPISILFFALPQIFARGSFLHMQMLLGFWIFIQALLYFILLPNELKKIAPWICAFFVIFLPLTRTDFVWLSTEHISNLFVTFNLLIAFRIFFYKKFTLWECLLIGVATCLTFNSRQNTLLFGLLPVSAILFTQASVRNKLLGLLLIAGSFFCTFLLVLFWLLGWGDLQGYFYTVFEYPRLYARATSIKGAISLFLDFWQSSLCLIIIILAAFSIIYIRRYRFLVVTAIGIGLLVCVAPCKPYLHYFSNLIPVVGLLLAVCFAEPNLAEVRSKRLLVGCFAAYVFISGTRTTLYPILKPTINQFVEVAFAVNKVADANSTLFVSGPVTETAFIQFAARTPPANTYFFDVQLNPYWSYILPQKIDVVVAEYISKPPSILALHKEVINRISDRSTNVSNSERSNSDRLILDLLYKFVYKKVKQVNDWQLFVRQNDNK